MTRTPKVAARILAADLACLGHEVAAAVRSGADLVHVDVMELDSAHESVGPRTCAALRRVTRAPLEIHLMVKPTDGVLAAYAGAGGDVITFHPEASEDLHRTILGVKQRGCKVGLAVAPDEPLYALDPVLHEIDEVLVTLASPGPDGKGVDPGVLRNIRALRDHIRASGVEVTISVDGGVDVDNAADLVAAGADTLVVGGAMCRSTDRSATILALKGMAPPFLAGAGRPVNARHLAS